MLSLSSLFSSMVELLGKTITIRRPVESINEYGDKELSFEEVRVKAIVSKPSWRDLGLRDTDRGTILIDYVKLGLELEVDINIGYYVVVDGREYRIVRVEEYPDHKEVIGVAE